MLLDEITYVHIVWKACSTRVYSLGVFINGLGPTCRTLNVGMYEDQLVYHHNVTQDLPFVWFYKNC